MRRTIEPLLTTLLAAIVSLQATLASGAAYSISANVNAVANAAYLDQSSNNSATSDTGGQVEAFTYPERSADALSGFEFPNDQFDTFFAAANVTIQIGVIRGSVSVQASSSLASGDAEASATAQWSETLTITSNSDPVGTPVEFLATTYLHRTITGTSPATAIASISGPFGLTLADSLASPNALESVSTVVSTTVGAEIPVTYTFNLHAALAGSGPLDISASVLANQTAYFLFEPITPGASYSTASGVTFVPEPSTYALGTIGMIGLFVLQRRRLASTSPPSPVGRKRAGRFAARSSV